MSKSQVKKLLAGMSKENVINVVMELYDARKEAREYLDYFVNPNEKGELEKFKKIVIEEFGDDGKRMPKCRFSVCRKALSDFKKLAPSADTLAEAMVFYVEQIYELSFCYGDMWEQYYNSAISNFLSTLKFLLKNNLLESMMPRIVQIMAWSWPCGYGFNDETVDVFCEHVPPQYHSKVEEADTLGKAQYYAIHSYLEH
ncbi:MAG: DUF6155 family protein [Bacteroidales bacterium]|nr:DUF6155 family protein [Bacteroidales bacterium]